MTGGSETGDRYFPEKMTVIQPNQGQQPWELGIGIPACGNWELGFGYLGQGLVGKTATVGEHGREL